MTWSDAFPWPGDARAVAAITVDFDATSLELGVGQEPTGRRSGGLYAARRGVDALLEVLRRHDAPSTFFVPGHDAEQFPDVVLRVAAAGHEIAAHGYLHEERKLEAAEEDRLLRRTHQILSDLVAPPVGWRSPGGHKTARTLSVLAELGYLYDSSDKDDDLPYPASAAVEGARPLVEIPNDTSVLDDYPYYRRGVTAPSDLMALWMDEFDAVYARGGMFVLTIHPRSDWGSATPARVACVARLLSHVRSHADVAVVRLCDLARGWHEAGL
jgi:peptidoglycan-N-acetylglucosamine deacetylase